MKKIYCPLTGRENIEKVVSYDVERICEDWQTQFDIDVTDEFKGHKSIDLYVCKDTGLRFFYPDDVVGSARLYAALQKFDWYYMQDKWEHQVALQDLMACDQVLEIGAASGNFVQAGIDLGIGISGIELNHDAVAAAEKKGIPVVLENLEDAANRLQGCLDGVCNFQVLEHVPDPNSFIKASVEMLKSGGILILSVPNAESFFKDDYCLLDMPPHHITRWSVRAFKSLESMFSIRLEKVKMEPLAAYHVEWYLDICAKRYRSSTFYGRLIFNRITLPIYRNILKIQFVRQRLTGHTLYVKFSKL